ncbi:MAG: hypothetical protein IPL59_04890 [Candidatus Competibacteraceae bacterium]|nr:hypothetical protein [Candidatus Competibacteraceae bacterium]MBK8755072.1 hypothetical protein [Candidatus Competibacteraceae bacterium]
MRTTHSLLISAAIVLATPGLGVAAASTKDELTFAVSLDDKPIGMHRFRIADDGATRVVESEASFDVRILRVPVYRYRHRNTETWQNGCLKRIDSETDANGTPYAVDLSKTVMGYRIVTPGETQTYEGDCLMSFAYWDQRFLQQQRLLNTQTGELIAVEIQSLGESQREIANRMLSVEGFRILAKPQNIDIKVYYHRADGRWVALESVLENGRTLRYALAADNRLAAAERVSDPPSTWR